MNIVDKQPYNKLIQIISIKGKRLFVSLSKKGDYFINSSIFNRKTYSYFD